MTMSAYFKLLVPDQFLGLLDFECFICCLILFYSENKYIYIYIYIVTISIGRFWQLIDVAHKDCWKLLDSTSSDLFYEEKTSQLFFSAHTLYFKVQRSKMSFYGDTMKSITETEII